MTIDLIKRKYFASCQADGRTVRLKLAYELLDVNPHKFVFSGKRTIRGIPADVWIAEKIPDHNIDPVSRYWTNNMQILKIEIPLISFILST